jgi:hypothetical protein
MLKYLKGNFVTIKSFCVFTFLFLFLAKIAVVISTYSYAFSLMDWKEILYYIFSLTQEDLLIC